MVKKICEFAAIGGMVIAVGCGGQLPALDSGECRANCEANYPDDYGRCVAACEQQILSGDVDTSNLPEQ